MKWEPLRRILSKSRAEMIRLTGRRGLGDVQCFFVLLRLLSLISAILNSTRDLYSLTMGRGKVGT